MAYNTLIRGFCAGGKVERGEELVREMVMGGMEPTCLTYEHLIRGHCQVGGVEPALVLFDDMRRRGFRPEASVVDELVRELCSHGRVCDGLQVLRWALGIECFFPGRKSYECVIRGLCGEGWGGWRKLISYRQRWLGRDLSQTLSCIMLSCKVIPRSGIWTT